jgi:hypothetical protein
MIEAEWLKSTNPVAMLALALPRTTQRKLRLFACACAGFVSPRCFADLEQVMSILEVGQRHAGLLCR